MNGLPPTEDDFKRIKDIFSEATEADFELIKEIVYFDGWSDYEEAAGVLVFKAIDDSIQMIEWADNPFGSNGDKFDFEEVPEWEAQNRIDEMNKLIYD